MKFYTKTIKQLSQAYTEFVTPIAKGAYPIIDRLISYGLPTAGAVLWSVYGNHGGDYQPLKKQGIDYALPAGLAFYGISQIGLTYAKPYVEVKEDDGIFTTGLKKVGSMAVEVVDILNNIVPYTIACNMLPNTYGLNEVAAYRILPSIIQGVESDIKAAVNKTEYTKTFAGDIYSTTIAGFASANLRDILSEKLCLLGQITEKTSKDSAGDQDTDKKIITQFIEAFSYPLIKKLLIKTSYEKNQIMQDLAKGFMKDQITGLSKIKGITNNIDSYFGIKDQSIFEGISNFAIIDLALKAIAVGSENIAEFEIHCDEYPELCPVDDVIIYNTEF